MNYKIVDMENYYRKGVFRHFSEDCKCSISMTHRLDVTELERYSRRIGTKFYINFLYLLAKVLNSREDYRMGYLWQTKQVIVYDKINPTQYIFHDDTDRICGRRCLFCHALGMDHETRGIDPFAADRFSDAKCFRRRR